MTNKHVLFLWSSGIILVLWGYSDLIEWFNDRPAMPEFTLFCLALLVWIGYGAWREHVEFKHNNRSFKDVTNCGIEWHLRRKGFLAERRITGARYYV